MTQHPPVHHPKNLVLGFHGWDETVPQGSVYLVSIFFLLLLLFFPARFFSLAQFFFSGNSFFITFFLAQPWPQVFFGKLLPTPTHLLPFFLPTHLPPSSCWPPPHPSPFVLTSITRASDLERAWVAQSFRNARTTRVSRVGSFKSAPAKGASTWWQQECESKRNFKVVAEVGAWR